MGSELETLVERILLLARLDAGKVTTNSNPIDLELLLMSTWNSCSQASNCDPSLVHWQLPKGIVLASDSTLLSLVFRNLFSNALSHGLANHSIDIECERDLKSLQVHITNSCHEIDESELPRLKERFYLRDLSRSQTGNHSGLGLSLCVDILKLLNGRLELGLPQKDRFRATVFLSSIY